MHPTRGFCLKDTQTASAVVAGAVHLRIWARSLIRATSSDLLDGHPECDPSPGRDRQHSLCLRALSTLKASCRLRRAARP